MNAPELELFCRLEVDLAPIRELGLGRAGMRRIIPIIGGRASSPYVTGRILNLGADWQTVFADGVAELDTRYAIETEAGHTIEVKNFGQAASSWPHWPGLGYPTIMRTRHFRRVILIFLINRTLFVGTGATAISDYDTFCNQSELIQIRHHGVSLRIFIIRAEPVEVCSTGGRL